MQWDESKFGGVNVLRVYPSDIWLPDIEVYNAKVMQLAVQALHCRVLKGICLNRSKEKDDQVMAPTVQEYREFSLAAQYRNEPCMALVYPDGEVLFIPPVDIKVKTPSNCV